MTIGTYTTLALAVISVCLHYRGLDKVNYLETTLHSYSQEIKSSRDRVDHFQSYVSKEFRTMVQECGVLEGERLTPIQDEITRLKRWIVKEEGTGAAGAGGGDTSDLKDVIHSLEKRISTVAESLNAVMSQSSSGITTNASTVTTDHEKEENVMHQFDSTGTGNTSANGLLFGSMIGLILVSAYMSYTQSQQGNTALLLAQTETKSLLTKLREDFVVQEGHHRHLAMKVDTLSSRTVGQIIVEEVKEGRRSRSLSPPQENGSEQTPVIADRNNAEFEQLKLDVMNLQADILKIDKLEEEIQMTRRDMSAEQSGLTKQLQKQKKLAEEMKAEQAKNLGEEVKQIMHKIDTIEKNVEQAQRDIRTTIHSAHTQAVTIAAHQTTLDAMGTTLQKQVQENLEGKQREVTHLKKIEGFSEIIACQTKTIDEWKNETHKISEDMQRLTTFCEDLNANLSQAQDKESATNMETLETVIARFESQGNDLKTRIESEAD
eukprot:PhF_6_TR31153/c1_g1_i1/m.45649